MKIGALATVIEDFLRTPGSVTDANKPVLLARVIANAIVADSGGAPVTEITMAPSVLDEVEIKAHGMPRARPRPEDKGIVTKPKKKRRKPAKKKGLVAKLLGKKRSPKRRAKR